MIKPKFKIGDRVILVRETSGWSGDKYATMGEIGTVSELSDAPWVIMDEINERLFGNKCCFDEDELELVEVYNSPVWKLLND